MNHMVQINQKKRKPSRLKSTKFNQNSENPVSQNQTKRTQLAKMEQNEPK